MNNAIKQIKIGDLVYKNNLFLAPMEGFTNVSFRKNLIKYEEIGLFSEMIPSTSLSKSRNYCKDLIYRDNSETNLTYQLFGNDPKNFVNAVITLEPNADAYNINSGCPVEKVISQGAGCALLKRKNRIYSIIKEMRKVTEKPITLKIRTGYTKAAHLDYDLLRSFGCDAIFIHARTCKQKYAGNVDYNFLKEAKDKSTIPIIGNGDLCNLKSLNEMYENTNVDGFMIGRACLHNPAIFRDLVQNKNYDLWATTISKNEKELFLRNYYNDLVKYDIKTPFNKLKTLSMFMFRFSANAKKTREFLVKTKSEKELFEVIRNVGDK